jgi:hypothetical protein
MAAIYLHVRAGAVRGSKSYTAWGRLEATAQDTAEAYFAEKLQQVVPQMPLGLTARGESKWLLETLRKLNTDCRAVEVQAFGSWSAVAEYEATP